MKSILFLLLISMLNSAFAFTFSSLPDLGDSSLARLTPTKEQELGTKYIHEIQKSGLLLTDPVINNYIETLGQRLVSAAKTQKSFHFFVVADSEINAFAGPAGYIGCNSGLILAAQNEDELAAVLAHEIAHVIQNHIARGMDETASTRIPAIAGVLAAIALGSINPVLGSGALAATTAGYMQTAINFTRAHEREADRVGLEILHQADYSPQAMPNFFQRIAQSEQLYPDRAPEILQTHPYSYMRIADAENRIAQYPAHRNRNNLLFDLVQARTRVLTTRDNLKLLDYFQRSKTNAAHQNAQFANEYGVALTELRLKNISIVKQDIGKLMQKLPDETLFSMTLAESEFTAHHTEAALAELQHAYAKNPDYFPLILQYGYTLLEEGESLKAKKLLEHEITNFPKKPQLYYLLARAEARLGDMTAAHLAQARFYSMLEDHRMALHQLQLAAHQNHQTEDTKDIIKARIEEEKRMGI